MAWRHDGLTSSISGPKYKSNIREVMAMEKRNAERIPVRLEDLPWEEFPAEDPLVKSIFEPGTDYKALIEPSPEKLFIYLRFPPNFVGRPHWHTSPTIYIMTQGEFHVVGEGIYRAGEFRWVDGGFAYGAETAGPEGCEFYLGSLGPFGTFDPEVTPPPRGYYKNEVGSPSA
jgi:hypothetical protein